MRRVGSRSRPLQPELRIETVIERTELRIQLGDVCIGVRCGDREVLEKMRASYQPFLASSSPDFRIEFSLRYELAASEIRSLLASSRRVVKGNRCIVEPALVDMSVDWKGAFLRVETEAALFGPGVDYKLMNNLMVGIYAGVYGKLRNTVPTAYLTHGCGIGHEGRCFLFTGPSGAGKTTIAKLAGARKILNDEAVLTGIDNDGVYLGGTPLDGGQPEKSNARVRLSSVFFLKHDPQVSLRKLSKAETYVRLLSQFFSTSPLFEESGDECLRRRASMSARMATGIPSYELSFRPDSSFWQAVEAT